MKYKNLIFGFLIIFCLSFKSKMTDLDKKELSGQVKFAVFEKGDSIWYNKNGMATTYIFNITKIETTYNLKNEILEQEVKQKIVGKVEQSRKLISNKKNVKEIIEYNTHLPKNIDSCHCFEKLNKAKRNITKQCFDRTGKIAFKYIYSYDKNGNLTFTQHFTENEQLPNYFWIRRYNKYNKLTENKDSSVNGILAKHIYIYNEKGLIICSKSYDDNNIEWASDSSFYGSNNELILEKYKLDSEDVITIYLDYKYDINNNWIYRKRIEKEDTPLKQDTTEERRTFTYYK